MTPDGSSRVTQEDIAAQVNRSRKVVSQALRGSSAVSAETREEVWRAAQDLGYRAPRERTGRIGVVTPSISHHYWSLVLHALHEAAAEDGFGVDLRVTGTSRLAELQAIAELDTSKVEGLILLSPGAPAARLQPMINRRRPIVAVNSGLVEQPGLSCLGIPNLEAGFAVMSMLLERHHTQIGYLAGRPGSHSSATRLEGCRSAMLAAGIEDVDEHLHVFQAQDHEIGYTGGHLACEQLLDSDLRSQITAIVAYNDVYAVGALRKLIDWNLRVPEDYSLVGFGGLAMTPYTEPRLATVELPAPELGRGAVRMLLEMSGGETQQRAEVPGFRPQWRASVGDPRGATAVNAHLSQRSESDPPHRPESDPPRPGESPPIAS